MADNMADSYMDLDEFFAFRNILCELPDTTDVFDGEEDGAGDHRIDPVTSSSLNVEPSIASDCHISGDYKNIIRDSDSDEGKGGSVTSETPSNSATESRTSRKKKAKATNGSERKAKRQKGKSDAKTTLHEGCKTSNAVQDSSDGKDEKYWIRRKRNNLAAKKSRDQKRQQELYTAQRASFLEKENGELKREIARLKDHLNSLNDVLKQKSNDKSQS